MIEKERLEELIEEGATIYEVKYGKVNTVSLKNKIRFVSDRYPVVVFEPRPNEKYKHHKYFDKLFEDREDAEWVAKHYTTRLELFEPPTWEEFVEMEEWCFWKKNHRQTVIRILGTKYIAVETSYERFFTGDLTKENYIKAVEKAYNLFKGEEE